MGNTGTGNGEWGMEKIDFFKSVNKLARSAIFDRTTPIRCKTPLLVLEERGKCEKHTSESLYTVLGKPVTGRCANLLDNDFANHACTAMGFAPVGIFSRLVEC